MHLRLMFIANPLMPQHKQFLNEHGYKFREYPEQEFDRSVVECQVRSNHVHIADLEPITTSGVLVPSTCELLYEIERQPLGIADLARVGAI